MPTGGFDYSGMKQLFDQVSAIQKRHEVFIRGFLLEMGLRALAKTKKRTPADTGNLRRNWRLSEVFRMGDTLYVVLWNPVEYASYVEHGHRITKNGTTVGWWEGYHMAKISVEEIEKELPSRYERAFKQFVTGLGP